MFDRILRWVLPAWALPDHPTVRLMLGARRGSWQWGRWLWATAGYLSVLFFIGQQVIVPSATRAETAIFTLLIPTLLGQAALSAIIYGHTLDAIHLLRQNEAWDVIRSTAGGTGQVVRGVWAASLYRVTGWIWVVVYAPRAVLLGVLLLDVTSFRGELIDQMASSAVPSVPWPWGGVLLALWATGVLLMPLAVLGTDGALGVWLSTFARARWMTGPILIGLTIWRFIGALVAVVLMLSLIQPWDIVPVSLEGVGWGVLLLNAQAGDWGLSYLHAAQLEQWWRAVPYSAYLGAGLVALVLLNLILSEALLKWAARRAQRA
jgi:hypothetical protein